MLVELLIVFFIAVLFIIFTCTVKRFRNYDIENTVPDDIEEVLSERLFPQQSTTLLHSSPRFEDDRIDFICKKVIPKAEGQRTSWQFAVLLLLTKGETEKPMTFNFKPSDENARLPINSTKPFIPPKPKFNNYIVARPEKGILGRIAEYYMEWYTKHAETIVLNEFEDLLLAYESNNKEVFRSIILYTWIMPCTKCTTKIITKMVKNDKLVNRELEFTVAYTLHYRYDVESEEEQEKSRENLRKAGITVKCIPYQKRLKKKTG